jgi:hypothetical protein
MREAYKVAAGNYDKPGVTPREEAIREPDEITLSAN